MPRISSKNQVTLPVEVLRAAGMKAGDSVAIDAKGDGEIVIVQRGSRIRRHSGIVDGLYPPGYLDRLRDEWER